MSGSLPSGPAGAVARAPATSANLGPGFDCLGVAISLELEVLAQPSRNDTSFWTASFRPPAPAEDVPPDLVWRAAALVTGELPRIDVAMTTTIPVARGLGSSAAAIAAGLLVGCALVGRDPDPQALLELGVTLEGHADNLAPCLFGGLCLVVDGRVLRFDPVDAVRPGLLVPPVSLATETARGVLPDALSRADAVASASRTAGLLALLSGAAEATPERLLACTEDVMHQPYRAPLMPATADVIARLRERGVPAVLSGAGPSVLCLLTAETVGAFRDVSAALPGWGSVESTWDTRGANMRVLAEG